MTFRGIGGGVGRGNSFTAADKPRSIARCGLRWLLRGALIAVMALVALAMAVWIQARLALPPQEGVYALRGPREGVTVARDADGVPTIRAASLRDAYFALGFTHAQDRLFQMEFMRRAGAGRLAEVLGPLGVRSDRFTRTLGLHRAARLAWGALDGEARAALLAYADGVNAWLHHEDFRRPPELFWLGVEPEPWQPVDSLLWGKLMALSLGGNSDLEVARARLAGRFPPDIVERLLAPPLEGGPSTVAAAEPVPAAVAALLDFDRDLPPAWQRRLASNAFAVGGGRSASGSPLLANDPHLGLSFPVLWYLARIEVPGQTIQGGTVPGVPFVLSGRNRSLAWGLTTTGTDTQDLVLEDTATAGRVTAREELIAVRFGGTQRLTVRETPVGPIVSDLRPELQSLLQPGEAVALAWTGHIAADRTAQAMLRLASAASVAEARAVLVDFTSPPQNVFLADRAGQIGFVAAGAVPLRAGGDGRRMRRTAEGATGFTAFLAEADRPHSIDPPSGWIANANNAILPAGDPRYIADRYDSGIRALRQDALLGAAGRLDMAAAGRIQTDLYDGAGALLRPHLLSAQARHGLAAEAKKLIAGWDLRAAPDRPEPAIFAQWLTELHRLTFADELGADYPVLRRPDAALVLQALDGPLSGFCDLRPTERVVERCPAIAGLALDRALAALAARQGLQPERWRWGLEHRARLDHPLVSQLPVLGPLLAPRPPAPGSNWTLNRASSRESDAARPFDDVHGPGLRAVHDLSSSDAAGFALAGGQSGNLASPHSHSFVADWLAGRLRPLPASVPGAPGTATVALMPLRR